MEYAVMLVLKKIGRVHLDQQNKIMEIYNFIFSILLKISFKNQF